MGVGNDLLQRIQILLVDMPLLLRELIEEAVAGQPDMHLVATVADAAELIAATGDARPDFVVFGAGEPADEGFPAECLRLLEESPHTKALAIEAVAGHAYLYELRPERTPLGEVTPEDVLGVMRDAAKRAWVG